MKNFIAVAFVSITLATAAFAAGQNAHYGNVGMVTTNIATSSGVASNASAAWPKITSGFSTSVSNQAPANALVRLRTRISNTNATLILIYTSSSTSATSFASYSIGPTDTLDIGFPLVDSTGDYYYSPAGGSNGGTTTNGGPVVNESFGSIQ